MEDGPRTRRKSIRLRSSSLSFSGHNEPLPLTASAATAARGTKRKVAEFVTAAAAAAEPLSRSGRARSRSAMSSDEEAEEQSKGAQGINVSPVAKLLPCSASQKSQGLVPAWSATAQTLESADPTLSFFYRPHTITLLLCILGYFLYVALFATTLNADSLSNIKTGLTAMITVFVLVGMLMFQNGPFIRPHPAIWRVVLACSVAYLCLLVFMLFQTVDGARTIVALYDAKLGVPLPERDYATDCTFSWSNVMGSVDEFVLAHIFGWYAKAIILRDYWICWIISVMFELAEYSLQHQLPNFAECWWDHWILDVLTCNAIGIWAGIKTCQYFQMRVYSWATASGKMKRTVAQFTPVTWTAFDWAATRSLKNYLVALLVIFGFLQAELNCFYLKALLWIPPPHSLNIIRVFLMGFMGMTGVREVYQYFYDANCKRLGAQAWVTLACIWTETLICVKFGKNEYPNPMPDHIFKCWVAVLALLVLYPIYRFYWLPRRFAARKA